MKLEQIEHAKKAIENLPEAQAAMIVIMDKEGKVQINSYGQLAHMVFIEKAVSHYNFKIMSGDMANLEKL